MTDKSIDSRLKNALSPSYVPGEDINSALIEKLRMTDRDKSETIKRLKDARRPVSWMIKAAIFFLILSVAGTGGVMAASYLLKESNVTEHGITVNGTIDDKELAEEWEDVPEEHLGTEESTDTLWYSKEEVLTNGMYHNAYFSYHTYEDAVSDTIFDNIFSEPVGTPTSMTYVETRVMSGDKPSDGEPMEQALTAIFDYKGHRVYLSQSYMPGASVDSTYSVCLIESANTRHYISAQGIDFTLVDDLRTGFVPEEEGDPDPDVRTYVMLSYDKFNGFICFDDMEDADIHDILDKIVLN